MAGAPTIRRDRIVAGIAVAAIEAALGYLMLAGFPSQLPQRIEEGLHVFTITPASPPPPPRRIEPAHAHARPAGAASPPNLVSRQTAIVTPPPAIPLIVPPTIVAAPKPGAGADPTAGNAAVRGPGTGHGSDGNGTGSGGAGEGSGSGDETPPRWRSGHLHNSDFPRAAFESGAQGTVSVRYTVAIDGRATDCVVTRSSGSAALDATTCRLIEKRLRFHPALDAAGHAVSSAIEEDHTWLIEQEVSPEKAAEPR